MKKECLNSLNIYRNKSADDARRGEKTALRRSNSQPYIKYNDEFSREEINSLLKDMN